MQREGLWQVTRIVSRRGISTAFIPSLHRGEDMRVSKTLCTVVCTKHLVRNGWLTMNSKLLDTAVIILGVILWIIVVYVGLFLCTGCGSATITPAIYREPMHEGTWGGK